MTRTPILFGAVLAVFAMLGCSRPPADTQTSLAPRAGRPAWVKEQGIVMVGNWEPLIFRLRLGGRYWGTDVIERWEAEHAETTIPRLKELGVNLIITNLHKGFGLKAEAEDIEATRKLTERAHEHGIRVGGYVGATMMAETFFAEEPDAPNWRQVNEWGQPFYYNAEQTYRFPACRNNPGYREFIRKVLRLGIQDLKLDLIHFDQMQWWPEPRSCRCSHCQEKFRAFLSRRYDDKLRRLRFGFTRLDDIAPPPFGLWSPPIPFPQLQDPLMQEWTHFRAQSLAGHYADFDGYIHSLNPEVALEGNPNLNFAMNKGFMQGEDLGQLLEHGDIVWSESPHHAAWTPDGRLVSKIRAFKAVRIMGKSLFVYSGNSMFGAQSPPELMMAEAIAFNDMNLGMVGDPTADGTSLSAGARRYIDFFHSRAKDLVHTTPIADAAVLRSFNSIEFNPGRCNVSTVLFEQTLIQSKIPFALIFDRHLKELDRYKVLVLANQEALSDDQVALVREFVRNGGGLVATDDSSLLTDWRRRRSKFALADVFGVELPPPASAENKPLRTTFGKGRVVYIPRIEPAVPPPPPQMTYDFANEHWKLPKNWRDLAAAVSWAAGDRLSVSVEAPLSVTLELAEQKDTGTRLLHLLNYDVSKPLANIPVSVLLPAGRTLGEVTLESPDEDGRQTLNFTVREGVASFRIPKLKIYDLVLLRIQTP